MPDVRCDFILFLIFVCPHPMKSIKEEPQLFKYRILDQKNKKVVIETDEDQFQLLTQALQVI